jgi:UDP-N-acetylglucosamine--N-acetylmuramyl-(pentapeptide) pyrophosphoryl-undecaprenol N-acetylglucosamine transferase
MSMGARHIVLAAGGTGGHVVPAHALALELTRRGFQVSLITDERGKSFPGLFPGVPKHVIPAATASGFNPVHWLRAFQTVLEGRAAAGRLYDQYQPAVVVGFGGYPSLPALWAATKRKMPTILHEQNAVLGRVNRYLAKRVSEIALSLPRTRRVPVHARDKTELTGNPVRPEILALRDLPYPPLNDDSVFRVTVIGGSQGARILSDVVPRAMAMLPAHLRHRLQVTQQCRAEDLEAVRQIYAAESIPADCTTYIEDMAGQLKWTHLVIGRAGASTISELSASGRPAILVPLPSATDDHQTANCRELVQAGGARLIAQTNPKNRVGAGGIGQCRSACACCWASGCCAEFGSVGGAFGRHSAHVLG